MLNVDMLRCTLCGVCEVECRMFALTVRDGRLEILHEVCDLCLDCLDVCEGGALFVGRVHGT